MADQTQPATLDFSTAQPLESQPPQATSGAALDFNTAQPLETDTQTNTGEQVNDVGNKVIVPKDGESFADTMKRAAAYGKTVTPAQINAEMKTAPKKAAQVLTAAPAIGATGAAALAVPTTELGEALPNVLTHTIDGVKAIGTWASKNPIQAYVLYNVMKDLLPSVKKATGLIKNMPEIGVPE